MAKDPAFLFYYDRFMSGTFTMSDTQIGQYIRLMCIQANKGFVLEKDMVNICKSYDKDIFDKFENIGEDKLANRVLSEILEERRNYSNSRRNNRLSGILSKKESSHVDHMLNTCKSSEDHMVSVNVIIDILNNKSVLNGFSNNDKTETAMVVIEMMNVWMKYKPDYTADNEVDYPALLSLAYYISGEKNWKKSQAVGEREVDVVKSWTKIVDFLKSTEADKYFKRLTIDGVSNKKNIQKIVEAMKSGSFNIQHKQAEQEKNRITPDQYFTE